jgi:hypothetical protein
LQRRKLCGGNSKTYTGGWNDRPKKLSKCAQKQASLVTKQIIVCVIIIIVIVKTVSHGAYRSP